MKIFNPILHNFVMGKETWYLHANGNIFYLNTLRSQLDLYTTNLVGAQDDVPTNIW